MGGTNVDFPQPSFEERELQRRQISLLDQQSRETEAFKPLLLSQFGLRPIYGPDPRQVEIFNRLDAIRAGREGFNNEETNALQTQLKNLGYSGSGGPTTVITGYEKSPEQAALDAKIQQLQGAQYDVSLLQAGRLRQALEGNLPISQGSIDRKNQQFQQLKEQSARAGNPIFGDTPESAFSNTTSGAQLLKSFTEQWRAAEDAERRGEITQGFGNLGTASQTSGIQSALGKPGIPDLGTGRLLPGYISALQPYQFERSGQFQANQLSVQNRLQREAGILQAIGQGGGAATALIAMSSLRYKKNVKPVESKKEEKALSSLRSTKMYTFNYKDEPNGHEHQHHGPVAELSPKEIVSPDGEHIDVMSYVGLLHSSLRALDRKINRFVGQKKEGA